MLFHPLWRTIASQFDHLFPKCQFLRNELFLRRANQEITFHDLSPVHHTKKWARNHIFTRKFQPWGMLCRCRISSGVMLCYVGIWRQMRKFFLPELMFHVKLCHVEKCDNILIRAFLTPCNQLCVEQSCERLEMKQIVNHSWSKSAMKVENQTRWRCLLSLWVNSRNWKLRGSKIPKRKFYVWGRNGWK